MKTNTQRNLAVDWLKGWMIICVVLLHTWSVPGFRGYLAVDVFFFISGYYMMQSFLRKPTTAVRYSGRRVKSIAIPFFICILFSCCLHFKQFTTLHSFDAITEQFAEVIYSFSFTERSGINLPNSTFLRGSWFLSVLIIGSFLLYSMIEYDESLATRILFPLISILGFNAIISRGDSFDTFFRINILDAPLIRGLSEMAFGALICNLYYQNKSSLDRRTSLINIAGVLSFVLFVMLMFCKEPHDQFLIITVPWFLLAAVIDKSWLSSLLSKIHGGVISIIGRYTLYILCIHDSAILLTNYFNTIVLKESLHGVTYILAVFLATALSTFLLVFVSNRIKQCLNRNIQSV